MHFWITEKGDRLFYSQPGPLTKKHSASTARHQARHQADNFNGSSGAQPGALCLINLSGLQFLHLRNEKVQLALQGPHALNIKRISIWQYHSNFVLIIFITDTTSFRTVNTANARKTQHNVITISLLLTTLDQLWTTALSTCNRTGAQTEINHSTSMFWRKLK